MKEGDAETWYSYYCVMKLRWKPDEFVSLPQTQKAMMIAFIDDWLTQEKKTMKKK